MSDNKHGKYCLLTELNTFNDTDRQYKETVVKSITVEFCNER